MNQQITVETERTNKNPNTRIQQLTNEAEQIDKNSNIWKMFDNQSKSFGGMSTRKQEDGTKNETQM